MKKVLVLMMSLMLCLGMAACGSKDEGSDSGRVRGKRRS